MFRFLPRTGARSRIAMMFAVRPANATPSMTPVRTGTGWLSLWTASHRM